MIVPSNGASRDSLFLFADALTSSDWFRAVGESYGVSALPGAAKLTGGLLQGVDLTSGQIQTYIESAIATTPSVAPDGRSVYLVILPSGVTFAGNNNCGFQGYHGTLSSGVGDAFAVVQQCASTTQPGLEQVTRLASHEIIESATNPNGATWYLTPAPSPWTTTPWASDDGVGLQIENADICRGTRHLEGGFYYYRVLTNPAAAAGGDGCVPKLDAPYYSATASSDWFVARGAADIPITGWSTARVANWPVIVGVDASGPSVPAVTITAADSVVVNGVRYYTLNNGRGAVVHVSFPGGGKSGDWAVISISSFQFDANGQRPVPGDDFQHVWVVGAYIQ